MRRLLQISRLLSALFLCFLPFVATATTYYVDVNSANPTPPYTDWSTAATNIQNAIDAANPGDTVLVTNGIYQTGGETINGYGLTNRVAINKAVTVQSVNGPAVTVIQGYQMPPYLDGNNAVRCVYMTNNAAIIGFTLSEGATLNSGDRLHEESGGGLWCESTNVVVTNCVITANGSDYAGGGCYQGTLLNCIISSNSIPEGQDTYGGGAYDSVLINCTIVGNVAAAIAGFGGGAYNSTLSNCVVADNSALWYAASQPSQGGGVYLGTSVNCNIIGNSAADGGGAYNATLVNCIDYFNELTPNAYLSNTNYDLVNFAYTCTTPNPSGTGNIISDPKLASVSHISLNSPCRGAGKASATSGVDIDGNLWANPPSMGCFEPYPGNITGTVSLGISTTFTNLAPGFGENFEANISGPVDMSVWNFGDGTLVTNEPYMFHTWSVTGNYSVVLTAYNDTYPNGQSTTVLIHVAVPSVYYVNLNSQNPVPPYSYWSTAAVNIQDAVSVATPGSLVLVTNGITQLPLTNNNAFYYNGGALAPNGSFYRVCVTNPITVQSLSGPSTTFIVGANPVTSSANCVYLASGATLIGFTLTNISTSSIGAGIYAASTNAVITNCIITHCYGGAYSGTLYNCLLTNNVGPAENLSVLNNCILVQNSGSSSGSAAYGGILNSCLIVSNSAVYGGGALGDSINPIILNNCIISNNAAQYGGGVAGYDGGVRPLNFTNCILNNCLVVSNLATLTGGGTFGAQLNNCIISNNRIPSTISSDGGGGAQGGLLNNCLLMGNYGSFGGGAGNRYFGSNPQYMVLNNCTLLGNVAVNAGGGADDCTLNQCNLLQNSAKTGGGAASCTLNDCLISSNSATSTIPGQNNLGGGAYQSTLTNCILTYNVTTNGGGASESTLVNCTVVYNLALTAGGIAGSTADNCILYFNTGGDYGNDTLLHQGNNINFCCTALLPTNIVINITNAPLFVNLAGNDFHLQSTSPCINSGNNTYITSATDLDGNSRIQGGTVDIGAYEYQTPTSVISYAYLQKYGLPTDGSVDFADLDGTGFNIYQDWIAGLNPTNSASVLAMIPVSTNSISGFTVTWQSVSGILYNLQRSTNLFVQPAFSTIQSNIVGQSGTTSYTDISATNGVPYFYRVAVP